MGKDRSDKNQTENYEFSNQKIVNVEMEKEVKTSFIQYSMSVIMARALPDVRDGLKPVHRRILYAMYEDHLTYDKPFHKSAATVGNVLGRYHPHGDSAVYDTMVRMAQTFSLRYPLVEGHGNFGNIDGDQPAAYRYTEARMSRISELMLSDIEKEVIDFVPNFDNKRREPSVLPSRFPNLLVNGSIGIAVGMATNIPPHNLGEVIDGTIYLMDNPDASVSDLMNYIKGPDFPTYAAIYGTAGIYEAYSTGRGRISVRAKADIEEDKHRIIVTEIPYQVNKTMLVEAIAECVKDKRIEGITALRDESGKDGLRIVIEFRHDANGSVILNQLYKYTQLQDTCAVNMLALVDNVPKVLTLKEILSLYIQHQEKVVKRRTEFELDKAMREMHIYEGYKIAIDNIDEVIKLIRSSESVSAAKAALMERFGLSDAQSQAIVDMALGKLSNLERQKIDERLIKLEAAVTELEDIIVHEGRIMDIIKTELLETKRRFSDERRTEIVPVEDEIILEDLIDRHTCLVTMTQAGYIKRQTSDTYSAQRRGGKGIIGMTTKEEDYVEMVKAVHSHSYLLMFTNTGKVHTRKAYQIPEASRTAKGSNIVNILELEEGEKITAMIAIEDFSEGGFLTMVTKQGFIKRTYLSHYEYQRKGGKIALTLREGDELMYVRHTSGDNDIVIATKFGQAVRYNESRVTDTGRTAQGVIAVSLAEGDSVAGAAIVDNEKSLLVITENGYGKRCSFDDFPVHGRGGKGVICHNTERTGNICGIASVSETDDVMIITSDGTMIRTPVDGIPAYRRSSGGVIIMRLDESSLVVNFTVLEADDNGDEESAGIQDSEPGPADKLTETEVLEDFDEAEENSAEETDTDEV